MIFYSPLYVIYFFLIQTLPSRKEDISMYHIPKSRLCQKKNLLFLSTQKRLNFSDNFLPVRIGDARQSRLIFKPFITDMLRR